MTTEPRTTFVVTHQCGDCGATWPDGKEPFCHRAAAPDPDLRAAVRPIVADWFETGYEAGNLNADTLTDRLLALLDATEPELDEQMTRLTEIVADHRDHWAEQDEDGWMLTPEEIAVDILVLLRVTRRFGTAALAADKPEEDEG